MCRGNYVYFCKRCFYYLNPQNRKQIFQARKEDNNSAKIYFKEYICYLFIPKTYTIEENITHKLVNTSFFGNILRFIIRDYNFYASIKDFCFYFEKTIIKILLKNNIKIFLVKQHLAALGRNHLNTIMTSEQEPLTQQEDTTEEENVSVPTSDLVNKSSGKVLPGWLSKKKKKPKTSDNTSLNFSNTSMSSESMTSQEKTQDVELIKEVKSNMSSQSKSTTIAKSETEEEKSETEDKQEYNENKVNVNILFYFEV